MKRPLIGITSDYNSSPTMKGDVVTVPKFSQYVLPHSYASAVELAGGLPVLLPYRTDISLIPQYLDSLDGVVLTGGEDLDPTVYGQSLHGKAQPIDPHRQQFEMALLAEIEKRATPVLGICLGSQVMNVHRGGSLHQFLPDLTRDAALEHRRLETWATRHAVSVERTSKLASVLGTSEVSSNSSHKQAVDRVGRGLRVVAHAPDGVIEATEDPSFPFYIGVQWHPERQTDDPDHLRLFQTLVAQAGRHAASTSTI